MQPADTCEAATVCRSLVLKSCPSYAQTEVQLQKQADGSLTVQHQKLSQPAHKGLCLAFALQAMSQKLLMNKQSSSLTRPVSVHDVGAIEVRSDLAIAVIGEQSIMKQPKPVLYRQVGVLQAVVEMLLVLMPAGSACYKLQVIAQRELPCGVMLSAA